MSILLPSVRPACTTPRPRRHCCCYFIVDASAARRPLGEQDTRFFSTPTRPVPYNPFPQCSSPRFDRPGPRNITLACLAAPRHAHGFPTTSFGSFPDPGPAPSASTPAGLHCHKLPPTVSYYLPPGRLNASYHHNHNFAPRPPASRILGTPLQGWLSVFHWRLSPGTSLLLRRWTPRSLPGSRATARQAPGLYLSLRPSFLLRCTKPASPLSSSPFCLDHPAAPSPQNRTRAEGRKEARKEGRGLRARACAFASRFRGHQGPPRRQLTSTRSIPRSKPDFSS